MTEKSTQTQLISWQDWLSIGVASSRGIVSGLLTKNPISIRNHEWR